MDKIIIAFGENEDGTFWQGHFGDADYFSSYAIFSDGKHRFISKITNSKKDIDEKHGSGEKLNSVQGLLLECDCVVAAALSPNFKRMAENSVIQPLVVKDCKDIESLLNRVVGNFNMIFEKVLVRKQGVRELNVPSL